MDLGLDELSLDEKILICLFKYRDKHYNNPKMQLTDLWKQIQFKYREINIDMIRQKVFNMQYYNMVKCNLTAGGNAGTVWLTDEGFDTAESLLKNFSDNISSPHPENLTTLIQHDPLLGIKEYFTHATEHLFILTGKPELGKMRTIRKCLPKVFSNGCIPLEINVETLGLREGRNSFLFNLARQLTSEFNQWAAESHIPEKLDDPMHEEFIGKGHAAIAAFLSQWDRLREKASPRQTVVIFNNIEQLFHSLEQLDPQIFNFLMYFLDNSENGYFILLDHE